MHQAVLAQAVLDKAVERAQSLGAASIIAVHVLLGEDDEHTEDALRFAWGEVSTGTCAEGSEFIIEMTPGDGLRLAAIDIEKGPAQTDKRPPDEEGAIGYGGTSSGAPAPSIEYPGSKCGPPPPGHKSRSQTPGREI